MTEKVKITDTFGNWTVTAGPTKKFNGKKHWICRCGCGVEKEVAQYSLLEGKSKGCGCTLIMPPVSPVTRAKMVEAAKDRPAPRPKGSFTQSQETRNKISATKRAKQATKALKEGAQQ